MHQRWRSLDVLRGIAILGILPVNIAYFALPLMEAEARPASWTFTDQALAEVVEALFTLRFISIFAFLLGISSVLIHDAAAARGQSGRLTLARRFLALALFGGLHVVFLWYGDILGSYALTGLCLLPFLSWRARTLAWVGGVLLALHLITAPALIAVAHHLTATAAPDRPVAEAVAAATGPWPDFFEELAHFDPAFETAVYQQGDFPRQLILRGTTWTIASMMYVFLVGPRIVGLILLGMACVRGGWLGAGPWRRVAWIGLLVGLPIEAIATGISVTSGSLVGAGVPPLADGLRLASSLGMATAYAGAVLAFADRWGRWASPLAAVGRLAFTSYLLQSTIACALFYSWGLGWFGTLDGPQLALVVAGIWAGLLILCPLWTRCFGRGPLESVWRWLTHGLGRRVTSVEPTH